MATLDFIVLKINNNDISKIPKNEAVQMFLYSEEPLLLEVRRKQLANSDINSQYNINNKLEKLNISNSTHNLPINSASKTLLIEKELVLTLNTITNVSTEMTKTHTKTTQTDSGYIFALDHHLTKENAERIVEQEHNIFEQCLESEIDIEEITLRKSSSNERLGLTVCYSSVYSNNASSGNINNNHGALSGLDVNDMCTDVYISDIQPDSVAGRDGRLRQGDQILQINGKDIKNKEETEALIAENNNAVTLLVSRYLYADEDDFNDPCCIVEINEGVGIDGDDDEDELEFDDRNYLSYENGFLVNHTKPLTENLDISRNNITYELGKYPLENLESKNCSEGTKIPNLTIVTSKASTSSTKCTTSIKNASTLTTKENTIKSKSSNKESSDTQKFKIDPQKSIQTTNPYHFKSSTTKKPQTIQSDIDYEVEHIYETIPEDSESEPFYCSPYETSMYLTAVGSCSSSTATDAIQIQQQKQRVAQWLGIKGHALPISNQRQMARCSNGNSRSLNKTETVRSAVTIATSGSSSSGCLGAGSTSMAATEKISVSQEDQENSSSAYNTGGSNNSATKLGVGNTQNSDIKQKGDRTLSSREKSITIKNNCLLIGKENSQLDANITELLEKNQNQQLSTKILHTNETNLSQSILQQQLVKQIPFYQSKQSDHQFTAPNLSQYHFVSSQEVSTISHAVATIPTNNQKTDEQMVWKVKRRPDGTRYIVRRPARKCVLKERTLQLSSHIPQYTTTEDDTISEVKIGKYWPKEERKKHIERARERRLHQHQQQYQQEMTPTFKSTLAIADKTAHKLQSQRLRNLRPQEDVRLQYHRQHHNYFQLQFNSANSFQQSQDCFQCQQSDLTPVETSVESVSKNNYLPATNNANALDVTLVAIPAKTDQVQSENLLSLAKIPNINILNNEQNIQITSESNKPNNLLSITTS